MDQSSLQNIANNAILGAQNLNTPLTENISHLAKPKLINVGFILGAAPVISLLC